VEYIKKAVVILALLAVLITTSSFTYHTDTIKNISSRLSSMADRIEETVQQTTVNTGENLVQTLGVEKVVILDPANLDLPEPVEIEESIPCVIVSSDSIIAWILRASPINASGMTLNPVGIVSIGDMPEEKVKEELYHWWDAERVGPLSYYSTYVLEFGIRCISMLSSNDAYWSLPLEVSAKEYANQ
jgi:hypothetical protein